MFKLRAKSSLLQPGLFLHIGAYFVQSVHLLTPALFIQVSTYVDSRKPGLFIHICTYFMHLVQSVRFVRPVSTVKHTHTHTHARARAHEHAQTFVTVSSSHRRHEADQHNPQQIQQADLANPSWGRGKGGRRGWGGGPR